MKPSRCAARRLRLLLAVIAVLASACATRVGESPVPSVRRVAPSVLRVRVDGVVRQIALEEYVRGTIVSEFAPPAGTPATVERMLEVQAVLSRTFALSHRGRHERDGYDLCATTHCQLYEPSRLRTSRWASAAAEAVRQTSGTVLWFDREPAVALFHADCGGRTSTAAAAWGGAAYPYLKSAADDGPAKHAHATWRYEASQEAVRLALNADVRTAIGARVREITVLERDEVGRAVRVRLEGQHPRDVRGEVLRDALTRAFGPRSIKSTWFDVRKQRMTWVFDGRGFGHGVGLCQAGALARIAAGTSPSSVLAHYFPGTRLVILR